MGQENFNDLLKQRASEFKITPGEGAFESVMQKRKAEKNSHRRGWLFFTAAAAVLVAVTVWLWPVSQQHDDRSELAQSGGSQGIAMPDDHMKQTSSSIAPQQHKTGDQQKQVSVQQDVPASNEEAVTTATSSFTNKLSQKATAQTGLKADESDLHKQPAAMHTGVATIPQTKAKPARHTPASAPREQEKATSPRTTTVKQSALAGIQGNNAAKVDAPGTGSADVTETTPLAKNNNKPDASPDKASADAALKEEAKPGITPSSNTPNTNDVTSNAGNGIAQIQSIPDSVSQQPPVTGGTSPKSAGVHKWAVNIYHNQYFINQNKNTAKASSAVWPANSTPNEQAKSAFASGISLEYMINNRFSVSVGFNYGKVNFEHLRFTSVDTVFDTNQSSPLQPSTGSESTRVYQKNITDKQLTFVEIPVMAGFLAGTGKWKFHLQAGAAYQYLQSTSTYVFTRDSSIVETTEKNDIGSGRFNRSNIVVMTSATINYEVGRHFWIYAGPSARFNVLSHYESSYAIRPAAAHYGLQGGIKILF